MSNFIKNKKKLILTFVFVLVLSFGLRFGRVIFEKTPVFGDEAIYIRWSQVMRAEPTLRFLPLSDGKQPLFMWVTIAFLKMFDDPLIASRMLSVYTGVITTAGVFILALLLFKSTKISFLAGFIYAISPYLVFFDSLALADSMLSMFGVWSLVFAIVAVQKFRLDAAILSGFALGGALLTKSPAVFFVLFLPLTLILHKWPEGFKKKSKDMSTFIFLFSFTYVIAFAMNGILKLGPNSHMIGIRNMDYVYPLNHILENPLDPLVPFLKMILEYFWLMGPLLLIIFILLGIRYGLKKFRKETLILLVWGLVPIITSAEYSKTMTARYIYFSLPFLIILASLSLFIGFDMGKRKVFLYYLINKFGLTEKIITIFLVIFTLHALFIDFQLITNPQAANLPKSERSGFFEEWTAGYGIKETADYLINYHKNNPDEKIVVGTEGYFGTLPDGLQIYLNKYPEITIVGVGIDIKDVPQSLKESVDFGNKTFLLINNSRLKTDYNKLNLNLIAIFQKAQRKPGTIEFNLNGPQEVLYLFEVKPTS